MILFNNKSLAAILYSAKSEIDAILLRLSNLSCGFLFVGHNAKKHYVEKKLYICNKLFKNIIFHFIFFNFSSVVRGVSSVQRSFSSPDRIGICSKYLYNNRYDCKCVYLSLFIDCRTFNRVCDPWNWFADIGKKTFF